MRNTHRRSGAPFIIALLFVLLLAVLTFSAYWILTRVEQRFGPPARQLSLLKSLRYGFQLYRSEDALLNIPQIAQPKVKLTIAENSSVTDLCRELQSVGLVQQSATSCAYLVYSGRDRAVQPGTYTLEAGLTELEILQRTTDVAYRDLVVRIFAGWRLEEVLKALVDAGFTIDAAEFQAAALDPNETVRNTLDLPPGASFEGYFCPGLHTIEPKSDVASILNTLTACHPSRLQDPQVTERLAAVGLTYHQAITLASIIQRETAAVEEMPMIASVFYNRLAQGMKLETDPTVQYAIGYDEHLQTWWKAPLTLSDLQTDSAYNTYRHTGLPPGPISSPAEETVAAVLNPAQSEYIFFRAKCDGSMTHVFSITYQEHLDNACD